MPPGAPQIGRRRAVPGPDNWPVCVHGSPPVVGTGTSWRMPARRPNDGTNPLFSRSMRGFRDPLRSGIHQRWSRLWSLPSANGPATRSAFSDIPGVVSGIPFLSCMEALPPPPTGVSPHPPRRGVCVPGFPARVISRRATVLRCCHHSTGGCRGRRVLRTLGRIPCGTGRSGGNTSGDARVPPGTEMVLGCAKGGKDLGIARHRHPVPGMDRIAPDTSRQPVAGGRPIPGGGAGSGAVTARSPSPASVRNNPGIVCTCSGWSRSRPCGCFRCGDNGILPCRCEATQLGSKLRGQYEIAEMHMMCHFGDRLYPIM